MTLRQDAIVASEQWEIKQKEEQADRDEHHAVRAAKYIESLFGHPVTRIDPKARIAHIDDVTLRYYIDPNGNHNYWYIGACTRCGEETSTRISNLTALGDVIRSPRKQDHEPHECPAMRGHATPATNDTPEDRLITALAEFIDQYAPRYEA